MFFKRQIDLREVARIFEKKLRKIKVLAFDVDGILTTGHIRFEGEEMGWNRSTHTRDGYMFKELMRQGFKVGVITGGDSPSVIKRFKENLKLDFVYSGNEDKRQSYKKLKDQGHSDEEILYMGDEFFDLPLLKRCGFSATVPEASVEICEKVNYVTELSGGMGAAREVMDLFRYANGIEVEMKDF